MTLEHLAREVTQLERARADPGRFIDPLYTDFVSYLECTR